MRSPVKPLFALLVLCLAMLPLLPMIAACGSDNLEEQRQESLETRAESFDRAESLYPIPPISNYPMREALVKFTERQDLVGHPWYVYILGVNGNVVGYYVASTYPQSTCNFLSSTEERRDGLIFTAPSLDGFFFDYATDALVVIGSSPFYASDKPLLLEADPILIEAP
jgi:hypothetical protein